MFLVGASTVCIAYIFEEGIGLTNSYTIFYDYVCNVMHTGVISSIVVVLFTVACQLISLISNNMMATTTEK